MQAIVHSRYGPPDVLEVKDIDKPAINDDAVLVQVHAAGIGKGDWLTVRLPTSPACATGSPTQSTWFRFDVAGRIEAVGPNVTRLQPGDGLRLVRRVFAEYTSVPQSQLALKPANLTFEQAAAVPISGFAALQALRDTGGVQPGQQVVIIGASGGVGSLAVQLAKAFGAEVTGACSTKSLDMVRSIGADHVIDYTQQDFTQTGQRYDLILEMAGNRSLADLRRALTPKGTLVLVGGSGRQVVHGHRPHPQSGPGSPCLWASGCGRSFPSHGSGPVVLQELLEAGKVIPVIDRTFPLTEAAEAIRYVGERSTSREDRHHRVSRPLRRPMEKENEHGEGPHRARGLARRVHQWAQRRR